MVSLEDVLAALDEFDRFGGGSLELIAWELGAPYHGVTGLAADATQRGLIRRCGTDRISGEEMWRLTAKGRLRARERVTSVSGR